MTFYLFDDSDANFVKSGYVLNPLSSKVEKYFFNENTTYKENLSYVTRAPFFFDDTIINNLTIVEKNINKIIETLKEYELDQYIIGYTPILNKPRGIEIQEYLNQLDYKPNFIILDDDTDMENLIDYLIKTNIKVGLTEENVEEAILKLTKIRT